jgi:hypothetical protein
MADFNIQPIGTQIQPPRGMTLGEMVNAAQAMQAYQQAQQLNPIQLERAQAELARLQQLTPQEVKRATAEANVAEETAAPRISKSKAEAGTAEAQQATSEMGLAQARIKGITDRLTSMYNNPILMQAEKDPNSVKPGQLATLMDEYGKEQAKALGISQDKATELIYPYMKMAMENPGGLRRFLGEKLLTTIEAGSRISNLQPTGVNVEFGSGGQVTQTGQFGPYAPGQALPGTAYQKGLAPFTGTTETGAPGVFKGTPGGVVNSAQGGVAPQGAAPQAPGKPMGGTSGGAAVSEKGQPTLGLMPGEDYKSYQERVGRLSKLPAMANTALNLGNPQSLPNMDYTNDKILKLLEKGVDVGPIANAIAKNTGGVGLSSEQQEVMKYLEQRIRQQATRTNQDQDSIRSAFGSFGTNEEALRDIIYGDKGIIASERLYYQGIKKYQGSATKPNLAAVSEFENKFNDINQDPDVAHLLGVIGTKKANQLSKSDVQHLQKYFGGMSDERIQDLFKKRDELMRLVEGGK